MKYSGRALGQDTELSVEREGLRIGARFLDYADFVTMRPINHRVLIDTLSGEVVEVSMLGFSYDGFLEELTDCFSKRSMEALFIEEQTVMRCEGEYWLPGEQGRGIIILLPDAICVVPMTCRAIRIPLCFTRELKLDGYLLHISMISGAAYTVGRMGYDTKPFAERAQDAAARTKSKRAKAIAKLKPNPPYSRCGLFRTEQLEQYWMAAAGKGCCAIELFTGEDSATYLYSFTQPPERFFMAVDEAMEAMGINREIIFMPQEKLDQKPLYRMAVARSEAVRFLRSKSCGRLIHNATHDQRLAEFLNQ